MPKMFIGGSFAPPITNETLAEYRKIAKTASPEIQEVMEELCVMVEVFQQTPCSNLQGMLDRTGRAIIVPLEEEEKARIFDVVPWPYQCDAYAKLFESVELLDENNNIIPENAAIRNASMHLLWFAIELSKFDREPLTNDKLLPK